MEKVTVSAKPLREILVCLISAPHRIRELQMTLEPPEVFPDNPIRIILNEFNAAIEWENKKHEVADPTPPST